MGDLIIMKRSQTSSRGSMPSGESAAILFFTGVRYYRMTDELESPKAIVRRRSDKARKAAQSRRLERCAGSPALV